MRKTFLAMAGIALPIAALAATLWTRSHAEPTTPAAAARHTPYRIAIRDLGPKVDGLYRPSVRDGRFEFATDWLMVLLPSQELAFYRMRVELRPEVPCCGGEAPAEPVAAWESEMVCVGGGYLDGGSQAVSLPVPAAGRYDLRYGIEKYGPHTAMIRDDGTTSDPEAGWHPVVRDTVSVLLP